jgi:N-acetylmuramic acid 6-phosphate etherase
MDKYNTPLQELPVDQIINGIHACDRELADAVAEALPAITRLTEAVVRCLQNGGRLFYLGAGTSGRLGILDASECPPTYGVPHELVNGIIAGGDTAIRRAVEFAEDNTEQGILDLRAAGCSEKDFVIGISASGTTPYVLGALTACREQGIQTGSICCRKICPISGVAQYPVEVPTGEEFIHGSTRMKAGSATKMVLNMISTASMVKLGKVMGSKMVDMQLSNNKLIERGTRIIMEIAELPEAQARETLLRYGNVRKALESIKNR